MIKPQKIKAFMEKAVARTHFRPVLTAIYKDSTQTVATDGYRIHVDYSDNDYKPGLNATKYSAKYNPDLEGRYPDVLPIIEQKAGDYQATVNAKELQRAVKLACIFSKDISYSIRIKFVETKYDGVLLDVYGYSPEQGDCNTTLAISNFKGTVNEEWCVHLNGKYVLDMVLGLKHNGTINLNLSHADPSFFTVPDRLVVIMPMVE